MGSGITLKDRVKFFLSHRDGHFCVEEFPLQEWAVNANNLATRLSEWAKDNPQWLHGRKREGKQYKEWGYIHTYGDGQIKLI